MVDTNSSIDELFEGAKMAVRTRNLLRTLGIRTVKDLVGMTRDEVLTLSKIGPKSVRFIEQRLRRHGLDFKGAK